MLVPIVLDVWKSVSHGTVHDNHVTSALEGVTTFYEELQNPSHVLPDDAVQRLTDAVRTFFRSYRELHVEALGMNVRRWHEVIITREYVGVCLGRCAWVAFARVCTLLGW